MQQNKEIQKFVEDLDRYINALDNVLIFVDELILGVDEQTLKALSEMRNEFVVTKTIFTGQEV